MRDRDEHRPALRLTDDQLALLERAIRELHWSQDTPRERSAADTRTCTSIMAPR